MAGVRVLEEPPSAERFMEEFVLQNTPVLIKGAQVSVTL